MATPASAVLTAAGKTHTATTVPGGDDFVGLHFDEAIGTGTATLKIQYSGTVISKNSSGVFHQQENGDWYLFTQFEPTDARRMLPCFDEPSFKVPFEVRVTTPKGNLVVANTNEVERRDVDEGRSTLFHFAPTPPLSFGTGL